ncbi:allograft inflammatory factor 1-like, partial [Leptonychotes weddellii]|uniref:Allograft inflammatory factor 1-like n=1 Tax=Leptonychotes weddellii TaxID=9713 RepID=A0A7F8Q3M0_LEPWE
LFLCWFSCSAGYFWPPRPASEAEPLDCWVGVAGGEKLPPSTLQDDLPCLGSSQLPDPTLLGSDSPGSRSNLMSLKRMMEKLGVPKTHLEMKKMISEVTGGVSDTISYRDFVNMMLGKRSAVLKLVMMFEGKANESSPKPVGPPPERDIASLP